MPDPQAADNRPINPEIFISYASGDLDRAAALHARLSAEGFRVWFDKARLTPGCDWHMEIEAGCEAARVMVPQRSGVILSTSSVAAVAGGLGAHTYSAAKAGVIGLTQSVAAELWPYGVRVNAIVPGKISTPMTAALRGVPVEALDDDTPEVLIGERKGQARDIAAAAAFLASEDGRFITGESMRVDGGLTRAGTPSGFATGTYQSAQMLAGPQEQR